MDDRAAHAVFGNGGRTRVFWFPLERLTLAHCAALRAVRSPVVDPGGDATGLLFWQAWQAAKICAARNGRELRRAMWPKQPRIEGRLAGMRWGRVWVLEWAEFDRWLAGELAAVPRMMPGARRGKAPSGDFVIGMVGRMVRNGVDVERAWWMPFGLAVHMSVAFAEAEGKEVPVMSDAMVQELVEMGWKAEEFG